MKIIATDKAPAAIGPYSQGTIHGDTVYCSGQIGLTSGGDWASTNVAGQAKQALLNLAAVLKAPLPPSVGSGESKAKHGQEYEVLNYARYLPLEEAVISQR